MISHIPRIITGHIMFGMAACMAACMAAWGVATVLLVADRVHIAAEADIHIQVEAPRQTPVF